MAYPDQLRLFVFVREIRWRPRTGPDPDGPVSASATAETVLSSETTATATKSRVFIPAPPFRRPRVDVGTIPPAVGRTRAPTQSTSRANPLLWHRADRMVGSGQHGIQQARPRGDNHPPWFVARAPTALSGPLEQNDLGLAEIAIRRLFEFREGSVVTGLNEILDRRADHLERVGSDQCLQRNHPSPPILGLPDRDRLAESDQ